MLSPTAAGQQGHLPGTTGKNANSGNQRSTPAKQANSPTTLDPELRTSLPSVSIIIILLAPICALHLRWPSNSQNESGRFAQLDFGGWQKGGFQKGGFGGCFPGTKTGTRVRSPKPPFYETALISPSDDSQRSPIFMTFEQFARIASNLRFGNFFLCREMRFAKKGFSSGTLKRFVIRVHLQIGPSKSSTLTLQPPENPGKRKNAHKKQGESRRKEESKEMQGLEVEGSLSHVSCHTCRVVYSVWL